MKITAMTYNICSGHNLAREQNIEFAAEVIRSVQPDLCGVNEVRAFTADAPYDQADALGRLTGFYPVFGKSIDVAGGAYGNAFLTRHPLISREVTDIPDRFVEGERRVEHRTLLRCVLRLNGAPVTVLQTHFGLTDAEKRSAVETAVSLVRGDPDAPLIFMGDLNMEPGDPILAPLLDALHDTAGRSDDVKTFPSDQPTVKIDYILHSRQFRTLSLRSMDTQNSDHRPLIAELETIW
ncbi:MAG: endonuclease/exonuclease/phosphatase family protein [Clostridia bacterium]|nr:endonuclease/exonuclease/phosphatase family protein [Clostridia bacterium]